MSEAPTTRTYRYIDLVTAAFVTVLVCASLIGPAKITEFDLPVVGSITFSAAVIFFPLSYVFGDILTEVYGFRRARRVIWTGFAALLFASAMTVMMLALPSASFWDQQPAYETVFGNTWRIVVASITAYWCGEFVNSYVLAKMKVWQRGRHLWARTIGSTVFGEGVNSLSLLSARLLRLRHPAERGHPCRGTHRVRAEGRHRDADDASDLSRRRLRLSGPRQEDVYDRDTDFSPFGLGA